MGYCQLNLSGECKFSNITIFICYIKCKLLNKLTMVVWVSTIPIMKDVAFHHAVIIWEDIVGFEGFGLFLPAVSGSADPCCVVIA